MTIPSIKFQCPKCESVRMSINSDIPQYCFCNGKGKTTRTWSNLNGVKKVRKEKNKTNTRMKIVKD